MEMSTYFSDLLTLSDITNESVHYIRFEVSRRLNLNEVFLGGQPGKYEVSVPLWRLSVPIISVDVTETISETMDCNSVATRLITRENFTGVSSFSA
jgi:hypothetical protein